MAFTVVMEVLCVGDLFQLVDLFRSALPLLSLVTTINQPFSFNASFSWILQNISHLAKFYQDCFLCQSLQNVQASITKKCWRCRCVENGCLFHMLCCKKCIIKFAQKISGYVQITIQPRTLNHVTSLMCINNSLRLKKVVTSLLLQLCNVTCILFTSFRRRNNISNITTRLRLPVR